MAMREGVLETSRVCTAQEYALPGLARACSVVATPSLRWFQLLFFGGELRLAFWPVAGGASLLERGEEPPWEAEFFTVRRFGVGYGAAKIRLDACWNGLTVQWVGSGWAGAGSAKEKLLVGKNK